MRFALDSNILVYTMASDPPAKREIARRIMTPAVTADAVLPAQVIGEFVNAVRRRNPAGLATAAALAEDWSMLLAITPTTAEHVVAGARLALRHRLRFWDSVILAVARSSQAEVLLTKNTRDGMELDGVRILDPFQPRNRELVDAP